MKRALALSLAAAMALPLLADEPKTAEPQPAATTTAATQPAESPIVAAAKRSKKRRAAGKTAVITNETLKASKGHISTSHTDRPMPQVPEPAPGPEQALKNQQAEAAAAKAKEAARIEEKRKAEAAAENKRAASAAIAEEGLYETLDGDPATGEAAADKASQPEQKPPAE